MNQESYDEKAVIEISKQKGGSFRHIPNGIPEVETRLPLLYSKGLMANRISPQKYVELTATNPAKLVSRSCEPVILRSAFTDNI